MLCTDVVVTVKNEISSIYKALNTVALLRNFDIYVLPEGGPFGTKHVVEKLPYAL